MIIINLISPNQKRELKVKRVYVATKELVMLILLFTSIIAILLLVSKYVLDNRLAKLIERNASTIEQNREVINKISTINRKIEAVGEIQKNFKEWADFLITLANATPENISYNVVKINGDNATIEIKGVAKNREDLSKLKSNLERLESLQEINLPLKSLLPKTNNDFAIVAKIVMDKIQ